MGHLLAFKRTLVPGVGVYIQWRWDYETPGAITMEMGAALDKAKRLKAGEKPKAYVRTIDVKA